MRGACRGRKEHQEGTERPFCHMDADLLGEDENIEDTHIKRHYAELGLFLPVQCRPNYKGELAIKRADNNATALLLFSPCRTRAAVAPATPAWLDGWDVSVGMHARVGQHQRARLRIALKGHHKRHPCFLTHSKVDSVYKETRAIKMLMLRYTQTPSTWPSLKQGPGTTHIYIYIYTYTCNCLHRQIDENE